jgi:hypothetical protein
MKRTSFLLMLACAAMPYAGAQTPDGKDISSAIPIYFGQTVHDIGDEQTMPLRVYSITLARGQQLSAALTLPSAGPAAAIALDLLPPTRVSVAGCGWGCNAQGLVRDAVGRGHAASWSYQVATSGTYYLLARFNSSGVNYMLQVNAQGTPIGVVLPPQAGCLSGPVDSITYSLQLIAMNLPDTVSIGGAQACGACPVKPPLYSHIVEKLETALRSGLNVQACYDGQGNIFQVTLQRP